MRRVRQSWEGVRPQPGGEENRRLEVGSRGEGGGGVLRLDVDGVVFDTGQSKVRRREKKEYNPSNVVLGCVARRSSKLKIVMVRNSVDVRGTVK